MAPGGIDSRYRSSTMPIRAPSVRDTSISLQPATSSGTIAPTVTEPVARSIVPPTSIRRNAALEEPSTAVPSFNARVTVSRYAAGMNGAYASGSTENASSGISYGAVGLSIVWPLASSDERIQRVSPATITVVPSAGVRATRVENPGGSEPETHASHAGGISSDAAVGDGVAVCEGWPERVGAAGLC